jgi:hypothetical protein
MYNHNFLVDKSSINNKQTNNNSNFSPNSGRTFLKSTAAGETTVRKLGVRTPPTAFTIHQIQITYVWKCDNSKEIDSFWDLGADESKILILVLHKMLWGRTGTEFNQLI